MGYLRYLVSYGEHLEFRRSFSSRSAALTFAEEVCGLCVDLLSTSPSGASGRLIGCWRDFA